MFKCAFIPLDEKCVYVRVHTRMQYNKQTTTTFTEFSTQRDVM